MSPRRTALAGATAWVVVVALTSTLVWAVIGRVGERLESSNAVLGAPSAAPAVTPRQPAATSSGRRTGERPRPSKQATDHADDTASTNPTGWAATGSDDSETLAKQPPATPAPAPSHAAAPRHHDTPPHTHPTASPTASSQPATRRTWSGPPGIVTAECHGSAVSLVAAQPESGYAVEVENRGPDRLVVEFSGRSGGEVDQVVVTATCVKGAPVFASPRDDEADR